jgi:hypothetical protein
LGFLSYYEKELNLKVEALVGLMTILTHPIELCLIEAFA